MVQGGRSAPGMGMRLSDEKEGSALLFLQSDNRV